MQDVNFITRSSELHSIPNSDQWWNLLTIRIIWFSIWIIHLGRLMSDVKLTAASVTPWCLIWNLPWILLDGSRKTAHNFIVYIVFVDVEKCRTQANGKDAGNCQEFQQNHPRCLIARFGIRTDTFEWNKWILYCFEGTWPMVILMNLNDLHRLCCNRTFWAEICHF